MPSGVLNGDLGAGQGANLIVDGGTRRDFGGVDVFRGLLAIDPRSVGPIFTLVVWARFDLGVGFFQRARLCAPSSELWPGYRPGCGLDLSMSRSRH